MNEEIKEGMCASVCDAKHDLYGYVGVVIKVKHRVPQTLGSDGYAKPVHTSYVVSFSKYIEATLKADQLCVIKYKSVANK